MRLSRSRERELAASALPRPRCAACDEAVPATVAFCAACASTAQRIVATDGQGDASTDAFAAFVYGGSIAHAIVRMKYEPRPDLARPLGDLLWASIEPHCAALGDVVVVPVPLHPARLAERGFNQSALIAHCVARRLRAPLALALARTRDTPRQTTLDRQRRARNMAGAFVVRQVDTVANRTVVLVDDVRTTGATLSACAAALRCAGAARVRSVALAQAELL
jgi:ComF family protein